MKANASDLVEVLKSCDQDFEWYPTTDRMIQIVAKRLDEDTCPNILDIGAGDGRVLMGLSKRFKASTLYSIEKAMPLIQAQPEEITPVGTEFFEQNLACLPVDIIFCNPPYSQFETWAETIIKSGFAKYAYLIIPQRWKDSKIIAAALKMREAEVKVIHSDTFHDGDRRARAVIDILEIKFSCKNDWENSPKDPFDIWFDQNVSTFQEEDQTSEYIQQEQSIAKLRHLTSIAGMVESYNAEYELMENNYRAIFKLDSALLRELSVNKEAVREGIKKRMQGLKAKYWHLLFEHLDAITSKLSTKTKDMFLKKITGQETVAFTALNAYAITIWAIKNANRYFDEQCKDLFLALSTHEGAMMYKSNQKTWGADRWRYYLRNGEDKPHHYTLDYRIVVHDYRAISNEDRWNSYEYPGGLHKSCHERIEDIIAVMGNLGFATNSQKPRQRDWQAGAWQDFYNRDEKGQSRILFQVKAYKNGNIHLRFMPDAIKALNIEAGRLLGWIRNKADVVTEMGYTQEDADKYFNSNRALTISSLKALTAK